MFNVGGGELLVIMLIALIVLGPQRLPDAARQIGKAMGDLRRLSTGFQNEVRSALDTADDPNRVAARRNVLAKEPRGADPAAHEPPVDQAASRAHRAARGRPAARAHERTADAARPTSAQARAAAKKPATQQAAAKKAATAEGRVRQEGRRRRTAPR